MSAHYYAPTGGHPGQDQLLTDRAMFTEAYAVLPRGTMRDIVVSFLPHWELTRLWVLARPLSGFAETFSQYLVEVLPGERRAPVQHRGRSGGRGRPRTGGGERGYGRRRGRRRRGAAPPRDSCALGRSSAVPPAGNRAVRGDVPPTLTPWTPCRSGSPRWSPTAAPC